VGVPVPFQIKKGDKLSGWKAVVNGKTVELASAESTKEEASAALLKILPSQPETKPTKQINLSISQVKSETTAQSASVTSTASADSISPKPDKPVTGEIRKGGLAELSPAKVTKFREQIANAIATGNVSLDRALVSIFRDKVPIIPPEQYLLLSSGWELACEQYFVNGVPPAWVIILLGNVMVCTSLFEKSEPKKEEIAPVRPDGNPQYHPKSPLVS